MCVYVVLWGTKGGCEGKKERSLFQKKGFFIFFGKGGEVRLEPFFNMCDLLHLKRSEI